MSAHSTVRITPSYLLGGAGGLVLALLLTLVYVLASGRPAAAQPSGAQVPAGTSASPGVEVVGWGRVTGTPDLLRLDLSVTITRPDAKGSLAAAAATSRKVIAALKARRVDAKDIKTANLSLHPEYDYSNNTQVLKGYTSSQQVSVVLRDLGRAGNTIGAAADAGGDATRIDGLAFDLEGNSELLARARDAAVKDARRKAEAYARAAGRELGQVLVMSENTTSVPPVPMDMRMYASAEESAKEVPIEPGSQRLSVSVRVIWSFT